MEVDEIHDERLAVSPVRDGDGIEEPASLNKRTKIVPVDDEHPFELEAYIANYSGRITIYRLLHIAHHCPTLASAAMLLAIQYILQSSNVALYLTTIQEYNALPSVTEPILVDHKWVDEVSARTSQEKNKLEVELKQYSSNMIKESIRMAHRDLGDFYLSVGDYNAALKSYTKSREFCSTSQHVIDMCLSILQLLLEQRNYAHVGTYVFKAEAALDAGAKSDQHGKPGVANRDNIQTKIEFATALGHFGQNNYERAAYLFLNLGPSKGLGDWLGTLVTPGDIAIYGTLCALASMSRSAIRNNLVDSQTFSAYMEHEPYAREMIEAYMSSKFSTVLEILERYSSRHYFDLYLFSHVQDLTSLIRDRALVLYFQPFQSIRLERMGEAFGMSVEEIEQHAVRLIQDGSIRARVDSQNKILQAKAYDPRTAMFTKAVESGSHIQETNRKLLFRMKLMQADLVVKASKSHGTGSLRHEATVHEMLLE